MQEVRIRLWRAQRTSEQISEVNTSYIYRTASSAALDVIRRRRSRRAEHHQSLDDERSAVALARLMGWTEGKTRNLLYRGLADLRERLTEMGVGWERAEEAS